jgi:hypothetical protein
MLALAVLAVLRAREKNSANKVSLVYPKFGIFSPCVCGAAGIVWNIFIYGRIG